MASSLLRAGIWLSLLFAGGCANHYTWVARDRPWSERSISGAAEVRILKTDGMRDPPRLLATYNEAAKELNAKGGEKLATWSPEFLQRLGAESLTTGGSRR